MSSKVGKGAEKARITPTKITSAYNSQALQETTHIKMKKKKWKWEHCHWKTLLGTVTKLKQQRKDTAQCAPQSIGLCVSNLNINCCG